MRVSGVISRLCECLLDKGRCRCDGAEHIVGQRVAGFEILRVVPCEPDLALVVLPGERFEREIDRGEWVGEHDRCATFWIAEDEKLRGRHG